MLGQPSSARAWLALYESRLADGDWRRTFAEILPTLLPGAAGAAAHGFLRTAHAVRALTRRDDPVRRRELAFGLASWAARFQPLPGVPGARAQAGRDVVTALTVVPCVPQVERLDVSLIVDRVSVVARLPGFGDAIEAVDLDAMPFGDAVNALASAGARLFLATSPERFVFLHAITAPSALRLVAGAIDESLQRQALGALFQTVAAFYAGYSDPVSGVSALTESGASRGSTPEEVRSLVRETLDDHDIKLSDAALREWHVSRRPELLEAAVVRMRPRS